MKYFIFGILFDEVIIPIISTLTELIQLFIEKYKGELAISVAKSNKEVSKITQPEDEAHNVAGF